MIQRRLDPGAPGSKKYLEKYGDQLVCVRYKYDAEKGTKLKTVELLISEEPWQKQKRRIPMNKIVLVRVGYDEMNLQRLIKQSEGQWNRQKKLWEVAYGSVKPLGLEDRIIIPP
jgi:hypothetical protein